MLRDWFSARFTHIFLSFWFLLSLLTIQSGFAAAAPDDSALLGEMVGVISGTVRDTLGNPLPNMPVSLDGPSSGMSACTLGDGTYQFTNVETDVDWRVQVFPFQPTNSCPGGLVTYAHQYWNNQNTWATATKIRLTTAAPVKDEVNFALGPGGGISGHIYDETGAPVLKMCLSVYSPTPNSTTVANYYLNESNSFEIYGVPAGIVYIRTANNCGTTAQVLDEWYAAGGSTPSSSQASAVTITAGEMKTGIDFRLDIAGAVEGYIRSAATNEGIIGATVNLSDTTGYYGYETKTVSGGYYSFPRVVPGYYDVNVRAAGYGTTNYGGFDDPNLNLILVVAGSTLSNINIPMQVEATISGCVYQGDGKTIIAGAQLIGHPNEGGAMHFATTGSDGCYVMGGFATGNYLIYASAPGRQTLYYDHKLEWGAADVISLVSGQNRTGVRFSLPLAGSISGTILREDGTVITDQRIVVDGWGTTPDTNLVRAEVSRTDGTYTIEGLAPGIYKVGVSVMYAPGLVGEYYPNKRLASEAQTIVVRVGENVPGINFGLERDAPVTGRLLTQPGGLPVNVSNAYVVMVDLSQNSRSTAQVLPDGTFQVNSLEPGSYKLQYSVPGYARMFYPGTLDPAAATVVTTTTQGAAVNLGDIPLTPGISLTGRITAQGGSTPIVGAAVDIQSALTYMIGRSVKTDENGAYTIPDLALGAYIMKVTALGYETRYYLSGDSWANATPFSITSDHPQPVDIALVPSGVISGTVLGEDGKPIKDAPVYVKAIGTSRGSNEAEAQVGSDGTYKLSGLLPGTYAILANSRYAAAYSSVYYDGQPVQTAAREFVIGQDFMSYTGVNFSLARTAYTFTDDTSATTLTYTDQASPSVETTVAIPQGAVEEPTLFVYTPTDLAETQAGFQFAGIGFTLNAYQNETYLEDFQFLQPTRVELHYDAAALGEVKEADLRLMYFNPDTRVWEDAACGSYERHPEADWLAVPICHLSDFGLFEYIFRIYLPGIIRH